jgi:hypothetical protein
MNAKVNIRQPHYMKDMKAMFGLTTFDGVQDQYEVLVRYTTEDAASQTDKRRVVDEIKVIFKSSGETIVDYCSAEYSTLSIVAGSEFTSDLTYTVTTTDGTAARSTYPITTEIAGWDAMSYEC